jgi:hypothetical protein
MAERNALRGISTGNAARMPPDHRHGRFATKKPGDADARFGRT